METQYLTDDQNKIILECLLFIYKTSDIEDAEFQTRLGVNRAEFETILDAWPNVDNSDSNELKCVAINNALNEVCYGISISESAWETSFTVRREQVEMVYKKWTETCDLSGGIM